MSIVDDIIEGKTQRKDAGNISSPTVKMSLVLIPAFIGVVLCYFRFKSVSIGRYLESTGASIPFDNSLLILLYLTILYCQSVDFRESSINDTKQYSILLLSVWLVVLFSKIYEFSLFSLIEFFNASRPVEYALSWVRVEDALLVCAFLVALRGFTLISATDMLKFARFLLYRPVIYVYVFVIMLYYLARNMMVKMFYEAWLCAKNRLKISSQNSSRVKAYLNSMQIFAINVLKGMKKLVDLSLSITGERGYYKNFYDRPFNTNTNSEDIFASVILSITTLACVVIQIYIWGVI